MASPTSPNVASNLDDDTQLGEDPSEVTKLFHERLQAYKHACGYLEEYVKSTEKMQTAHGKEYEKVLKTINSPLKEGDQFDHTQAGVSGIFDLMRTNTQAISNAHTQTAGSLKGSVLPIFERLHAEIKSKQKELAKGVGKGAKAVDKAKAESTRQIDQLASSITSHQSLTAKDATSDPYLVQRGVHHRLHRQFQEENTSRQDMLTVQNNFSQFEAHMVQQLQQGLALFASTVGSQSDQQKALYAQIADKANSTNPLGEWDGFVARNRDTLIDPNAPNKSLASTTFANENHAATQPVLLGVLERKQGLMRKFESSTYTVTPARFFHEVKSTDDVAKDPSADLSLFLPDCTIGNLNGNLFTIKGKDVSKSKIGQAMTTNKEYEFRTTTGAEGERWYNTISSMAGKRPGELSRSNTMSPTSPTGTLASRDRRDFSNTSSIASPTASGAAAQEGTAASPVAATSADTATSPTTTATHPATGA